MLWFQEQYCIVPNHPWGVSDPFFPPQCSCWLIITHSQMERNNIKNHSMPSSSGFGQLLLEFEREPDSLGTALHRQDKCMYALFGRALTWFQALETLWVILPTILNASTTCSNTIFWFCLQGFGWHLLQYVCVVPIDPNAFPLSMDALTLQFRAQQVSFASSAPFDAIWHFCLRFQLISGCFHHSACACVFSMLLYRFPSHPPCLYTISPCQ